MGDLATRVMYPPLNVVPNDLIEISGPWPPRRLVIFLSRENLRMVDPVLTRLRDHWVGLGWTFLRYLSPADRVMQALHRNLDAHAPAVWRQAVKTLRLMGRPRDWWYFSRRRREGFTRIEARVSLLRALLSLVPRPVRWFVIGRSAGARVATLAAEALEIPAVVCLSYPFKHPQHPPEPDRVEHLATLRRPCLIVQGSRDEYGGEQFIAGLALSPQVKVSLWEGSHSLALSDPEWLTLLQVMTAFVDEHVPEV